MPDAAARRTPRPLYRRHMPKPAQTKRATKAPPARALPKKLAAKDRAAHAAKEQSLAERGFAAVALVRERRRTIDAAFVDIGLALDTLKDPDVLEAMGVDSWDALCTKTLQMSVAGAEKLIAVATRLRRELALGLGVERASAALAIIDATPEDDTVEDVLAAPLKLPGGAVIDVRTAPTAALWRAAADLRHAAQAAGARRRGGKTTTPEERVDFALLRTSLRRVPDAKATLVARGATKGELVRLEFPLAARSNVAKALERAPAPPRRPR